MIDLINAAVELMIVGMGIVYLFLALLVVTVNAMSRILRRYFPEAPPQALNAVNSGADAGITAAIAAAVYRYRATHKR
jgi:oxaloacetate decarboxylase gamma subunit